MSTAIELADKAEKEMAPVLARAQAFTVTDQMSYEQADAVIAEIRMRVKDRQLELLPGKDLATQTWKYHVALCKKYIDDPLEACKTLDRKRYSWKKDEERKAQEEADRVRKEAEKKEQEERLKLAERLDSAGMKEQANEVLDAPLPAVETHYVAPVAKVAGQSQMEHWTATIVDPEKVPREYCVPSQAKLNDLAKMMKGKAVCPGVKFEDVGTTRRKG